MRQPLRPLADAVQEIPLGVSVQPTAERVQFVHKTAMLRASLLVAAQHQHQHQPSGGDAGAAPAQGRPAAPSTLPEHPQQWPAGSAGVDVGADTAAAPAGPLPSPREQLDAAMYAAAKQHSNRGAAEECHARAQRLLRVGEPSRAVRLLAKACQLDPGNPAYAAALQEAQQIAVDNEAKHGADSNGPGRGADAGTSSSSAAGAAGEGAASTSSSALPRQRQGQQAQRDEQPQSRKQQRKERQQQQERAGQAVPEFQDRKRTRAGRLLRECMPAFSACCDTAP